MAVVANRGSLFLFSGNTTLFHIHTSSALKQPFCPAAMKSQPYRLVAPLDETVETGRCRPNGEPG